MTADDRDARYPGGSRPVDIAMDVLDAVSDGIVVVDVITGERVYANEAVLDLLGVSRDELADIPVGAPSTAEEARRIEEAIAALRSGAAREERLDSHVRHRSGALRSVEIRMSYHPGSAATDGHPHIVFMGIDVTEREGAERRLRASEEALRAAFDRSPVGLSLVSLGAHGERRIVRPNAATTILLDVASDALVGSDLDDHLDPIGGAVSSDDGLDATMRFGARRRVRRADGRVRWVEERTVELPDVDVYRLDPDGRIPVEDGARVALVEMVDVTEFELEARRHRRRTQVAQLVAGVSQAILQGRPIDEAYQLVVDGIADVMQADHVALALPTASGGYATVAASGPLASAGRAPLADLDPAFVARVATLDRATPVTPPAIEPHRLPGGAGPLAGLRFGSYASGEGAVTVMRRPGSDDFDESELLMLTELGQQLALAVALGIERVDAARLAVLEDRQRLADRLHDTVVQDLVASGMVLDALVRTEPDAPSAVRTVLDQLNATVQRLRGVVFDLAAQRALDRITEPWSHPRDN
jgi:PAS domain S-box-containing protein